MERRCWERGFCLLSGIEKRPLLEGCFSITTMVIFFYCSKENIWNIDETGIFWRGVYTRSWRVLYGRFDCLMCSQPFKMLTISQNARNPKKCSQHSRMLKILVLAHDPS